MEIILLMVAKNQNRNIDDLMNEYVERIKHYSKFDVEIISPKRVSDDFVVQQKEETKQIEDKLAKLQPNNVVLLDETGQEMSSVEFANKIASWNNTFRRTTFVIGGAYGFTDDFKKKYYKMSLSRMTLPHQLVRIFFVEQLYRAFTIIRNENYHH